MKRLALLTAITMYLLIVVGAVVRVSGSGLGCPDWPLCYGNAIPPAQYHALLEFLHRLLVLAVTFLTLVLVALAATRHRREPWVIRPAVLVLVLLLTQIGLGAVTVLAKNAPLTVALHLATALATFGSLLTLVAGHPGAGVEVSPQFRTAWLATLAASAGIFILILTGAYVTTVAHADVACPGFPACSPAQPYPGGGPGAVQMLHRLTMVLVAMVAGLAIFLLERAGRGLRDVRMAARALALAFLAQVTVGILMVTHGSPDALEGLHVATAALVWAAAVIVSVRATRNRHGLRA